MTHPEELLAGYVDGSSSGRDRATVDAHLRTCERCRAEVATAGVGRSALRRLPDPATPDLAAAVTAQLANVRPASNASRWYRYAGVAAAAVIVVAIVAALPKVGSGPATEERAADSSAAVPTVGAADSLGSLTLELQQTDYDTAAVQALAGEAARVVAPSETAGVGAAVPVGTAEQTARARACVRRAFPDFAGSPIRLISAAFEGTPAYLAVVLEGPAPGRPADTVSIWVADHASCQPLSFTTAHI
jgi:predicted anti-sigma-YlaC factor YlaD